jgi:recombination protein RecA
MAAPKKQAKATSSKLEEAMEKLNKSYGEGTVLSLNSKAASYYEIISTGSIGFDYIALGTGGFVAGKIYELMGWEGTGKSTICGHASANCQKKGGKVVYIDGEHAVDKNYFEALGVDTDSMIFAQPSNGEEGFQIAIDLAKTGEVDLIIIDSDSSLMPKKVVDGDMGDSAIGKKAVLNNGAYPKLKNACSENNVCLIVISQFREKIGVMFGNPTTTQGGHALKFYSDCRMEVSKTLAKEGDVTVGNITKIKVVKNKMSPPFRLASFNIIYGEGIDVISEIFELMDEYALGKKWGQTFTYDGTKYSLEDFTDLLSEESFYNKIKQDIITAIKERNNKNPKILVEDESEDQKIV